MTCELMMRNKCARSDQVEQTEKLRGEAQMKCERFDECMLKNDEIKFTWTCASE